MYRSLLFSIVAVVALLAVGCAAPAAGSPDMATQAPGGAESPLSTPGVDASPVATPAGETAGELPPDIADAATEWLAKEANVPAEDLTLVEAEQTEWTDSCFGLGGPAESCLQAMTPGWRITFEADGQQYEVRTDESGSTFRLVPQES